MSRYALALEGDRTPSRQTMYPLAGYLYYISFYDEYAARIREGLPVPTTAEEQSIDAQKAAPAPNAVSEALGAHAAGSAPAAGSDDALSEEQQAEQAARAEHNAFIRALDVVLADLRQRSDEGKITTPARWRKRAMQPEGTDARAFEEKVLSYIEEHDHSTGEPHAGRVAVPQDLASLLGDAKPSDDEALPELEVTDIVLLWGKKGAYLYSEALMANNYAHMLFLTAEDDDLGTFVDQVRNESKIYPRPMAASSFRNPPFLWSVAKAKQLFARTQEAGSFPDIKVTVTSIGQWYFYSDLYLRDAQAKALAEFYGVERQRNP